MKSGQIIEYKRDGQQYYFICNKKGKISPIKEESIQEWMKRNNKLITEEEKEEYKRNHPELEEVMPIVEEIDRNNISIYLQNILVIQEWMKRNNTAKLPRSVIFENGIRKPKESLTESEQEEQKLGKALITIRQRLIKPYVALTTEEEREEYKRNHPELEEVMQIVEEIDRNNIQKILASREKINKIEIDGLNNIKEKNEEIYKHNKDLNELKISKERPTNIEFNNALVKYKGEEQFREMLAINAYEGNQLAKTLYHQTAQGIAQNIL